MCSDAGCRLALAGKATATRPNRLPTLTIKGPRAHEMMRVIYNISSSASVGNFSQIPLPVEVVDQEEEPPQKRTRAQDQGQMQMLPAHGCGF